LYYVSDNAEKILGYPAKNFIKGGTKYLASLCPPRDAPRVYSSTQKAFEKVLTLPLAERDISMQFPYRVKKPNGELRWILRQSHVVKLDEKGMPAIDCALLIDITPFKKDDSITCQVQWKSGSAIFYPDDLSDAISFSKREIEIVKFIQTGQTSREIAKRLSISENTVKNHRKKIILKAEATNIAEALTKMRKMGVIE